MKRIASLVLSLLMILTLASCSAGDTKKEKKTQGEDLSLLTGEELYRYGEEKMEGLKSALYTTKLILGEEELEEFETVRIRKGYDGFTYSRRGHGFLSFDGERAYVESSVGKYTAPATARTFEAYLEEFVFSVCALSSDALLNFEREGNRVSYESEKEELLSQYSNIDGEGFVPVSLSGQALFSEEGVITQEEITLKGEEKEYILKTVLTEYRSDSILISLPEEPAEFTEVADIGLPRKIAVAMSALFEQNELQATLVSSDTLTLGEAKYAFSQDVTVYKKAEGEGHSYYLSKQSLKQLPEVAEESLFYQCLLTDGKKTENRYNVILGEKIWENGESAETIPWEDEIRNYLPEISQFETLTVTEEVGGYSVAFTLTEEAMKSCAMRMASALPESGITSDAAQVKMISGNLSVDEERGILTALSYNVEGSFSSGGASGSFSGRYSVLVDRTEDITLPELQTPTPTTPGMGTEDTHEAES